MIRHLASYVFCLFICLQAIGLRGQCHPYRYDTSPHSGWLSCDMTTSPNADRGVSHWLHYDLGVNHTLLSSWIWNHNSITSLSDGITSYAVDYRVEGEDQWIELGTYTMELSEGSAYYAGVEGPDFGGVTARYILITLLDNGGGDCYGYSEWKIETGEALSDVDEIAIAKWFTVFPNPTESEITIEVAHDGSGQHIIIMDLLGRRVMPPIALHSQRHTLNVNTLESGMYTICLVGDFSSNCQKISVVRDKN